MRSIKDRCMSGKVLGTALFGVLVLCLAPRSYAEQILLTQTTLVSGTESETLSLQAPSSGTVTVELQNLPWPQRMSSLSFVASTATQVLSSWSVNDSLTQSFDVGGAGTFFAHITGRATGPLDLGLFSLFVSFSPSAAPVPLPASGLLLLVGLGTLISSALSRLTGTAPFSAGAPAPTESPMR